MRDILVDFIIAVLYIAKFLLIGVLLMFAMPFIVVLIPILAIIFFALTDDIYK